MGDGPSSVSGFVFDQVRSALLHPETLLAGQAALAAEAPAPDDELLAAELARLERKIEAPQGERRRLADLYQAGLLDLADVKRRGGDRQPTEETRRPTPPTRRQRQHLATDNRLRRRVGGFARRASTGIDKLNFPQRQQLTRLVVDHVMVTGWQVEIHLRIPLDDHDGDHQTSRKRSTKRASGGKTKVSSEDGLRSLRRGRGRVLPQATEAHPGPPPKPTGPAEPVKAAQLTTHQEGQEISTRSASEGPG